MQLISWLAFAFTVSGCFLAARKSAWCWPVWIAGNFPWAWYFWHTHQMAGLTQTVVFFCLNIYGLWMWVKTLPVVDEKLNMAKNFVAILCFE